VSRLQGLQDGSAKYDFIEVMACPGGCIGGGGQPRSADKQILAVSQQPFSPCYWLSGWLVSQGASLCGMDS
jgi:hypothetical protein